MLSSQFFFETRSFFLVQALFAIMITRVGLILQNESTCVGFCPQITRKQKDQGLLRIYTKQPPRSFPFAFFSVYLSFLFTLLFKQNNSPVVI